MNGSAHTLFDIVRKLPEGSQVELTAAECKMQVVAGRARFNLFDSPARRLPRHCRGRPADKFELPAATLRQIIEKTRFAISSEETRYYLMGIFFHVVDEQLRAAATDGHRLARITVARPEGAEGMPDVIVPRKAVAELYRLLEELRGRSRFAVADQNSLRAWQRDPDQQAKSTAPSRTTTGSFRPGTKTPEARSEKLLGVVDRVSTIASEKTPGSQDQRRPRLR